MNVATQAYLEVAATMSRDSFLATKSSIICCQPCLASLLFVSACPLYSKGVMSDSAEAQATMKSACPKRPSSSSYRVGSRCLKRADRSALTVRRPAATEGYGMCKGREGARG